MSRLPILFDVNGNFGKPVQGRAEFPTIASRLAHMDRLGISRSLVWNSEAIQDNALSANRRLLDEIAHTPGAEGRIVPALVVAGLFEYERDGIQTFIKQMDEGKTRALRFVRVFGRLTLRQLAPVMEAIRSRKPFIVTTYEDSMSGDILDFTEKFPDVPVILTNIIWGKAVGAYDLMRERKNVLIETSWLHTWEGSRLLVNHFGADRVLFGTGYGAHNGAAIAALARADISADQRDQIAFRNLDQLTGMETKRLAPDFSGAGSRETLWQKCLAGKPLGVDIVDAHGHLGASGGYVLEYQEERRQIPEVLRAMDSLGQKTMIVSGLKALLGTPVEGNNELQQLLQPHSNRIVMYLAFNPLYRDDLVPLLDRYFSDPLVVGFKTLSDYWQVPITDPRHDPMWEYANRHRLPVLMHTWNGNCDSPAMLREIAPRYPDLALICGHSGGGEKGRHEAEALAAEFPNVYLEWCGSFTCEVPWEETLKKVGADRVVYGTDATAHDVYWELGRLLSVDVPDETLIPILGQTMRRILSRRR